MVRFIILINEYYFLKELTKRVTPSASVAKSNIPWHYITTCLTLIFIEFIIEINLNEKLIIIHQYILRNIGYNFSNIFLLTSN